MALAHQRLWPRWLFLRSLALLQLSAFVSLAFQIEGLIGPRGILPAGEYLAALAAGRGANRFLVAPTALWISSGDAALRILVGVGLLGSLLLLFNRWPRAGLLLCGLAFSSFAGAAQEFAGYQSDGMLLEATLIGFFFAPRGRRPGLGADQPPSRISSLLLLWLWFRIYFESGVAKLLSGEPAWRDMSAMDRYYETGPLPTWIGYYVQQGLPHAFHQATAWATMVIELGVVFLAALPRRFRLACAAIVTPFQLGIILTANYAFLNYLVLFLGLLLLDDSVLSRWLPAPAPVEPRPLSPVRRWLELGVLGWQGLSTVIVGALPWSRPLATLALPLAEVRVANRYALFAVMTPQRNEIEFQGSADGVTWLPYRFRFKPQDLREAPGIYAPYQPRFDWNLWFASLSPVADDPIVLRTQQRLLEGAPEVLRLFRENPFPEGPPRQVRAVLFQYGFTDLATLRATGAWWWSAPRGIFSPPLTRSGLE